MEYRHERVEHPAETVTLTALRIAVGIIFIAHGFQKLVDIGGTAQAFAGMGIPMPFTATYLAIAGELLGGIGLLLGLLTRLAALGPALVMITAIWFVHWGKGLYAQNGGWEFPLTLLLVSIYFVARGAGAFSIDYAISRARARRREYRREPPPYGVGVERPV